MPMCLALQSHGSGKFRADFHRDCVMDERTLGAIVFLIVLAISAVGLLWSSRQAERLDGERRRQTTLVGEDGTVIGTRP